MTETAQVLARDENTAVVHLDRRHFPGLMLQGDTFHILVQSIGRALNATSHDEWREELRYVLTDLQECMTFYEQALRDRGIDLPYSNTDAQ